MAVVHQLTDGNDDGSTLGSSATDKISFYGVTPIVQPSGAGQAAYVTIGQHSLVDNGGGTADATVALQAAPTTITDSSGLSGTHDDTLAATTTPTTLTDSTGQSGTHDDTLAATTLPTTLTDSTGQSGTHDDTLAATTIAALGTSALGDLVATQNTGWGSSSEAGFDSIATKFDALVTDITAIRTLNLVFAQNASDTGQKVIEHNTLIGVVTQNASDTAQKIIEIVALQAVQSQNISDLGQKIIELVTLAGVAQANLKEVTTELGLIRTDISNTRLLGTAFRTALLDLGLLAGA